MLRKFISIPRNIYHQISFIKTLASIIYDPRSEHVLSLDKVIQKVARDEDIQAFVDALRASPATAKMLKNRYLAHEYTLTDLQNYPEGSLGDAYRKYMEKYQLDIDYFEDIDEASDWDYGRLRLYQTHDIWHVMTGYNALPEGEASIVGFYLGHAERYMGIHSSPFSGFNAILAGCLLLHGALFRRDRLRSFLTNIMEGWRKGYEAKSFYDVPWEEMWGRPLVELQIEFNVLDRDDLNERRHSSRHANAVSS